MSHLRKVHIVPYDSSWPELATIEATHVCQLLGDTLVSWEHVGSTAVPGLPAKPIVDIMPIVKSVAAVDLLETKLSAAGYNWYGEYGLPGRRYLNRDLPETGRRIANIHIYEADNPEVGRHLAFREILRSDPKMARAYADLKYRCAALCPDDVNAYNDCKNAWIKATEVIAVQQWTASRATS